MATIGPNRARRAKETAFIFDKKLIKEEKLRKLYS
jgi:hypothetical protein